MSERFHGGIAWVAEVMPDWTTLQTAAGDAFAFNRSTGRVYKVSDLDNPSPECPFVIIPTHPPIAYELTPAGREQVGK
jgi:hypothetical protein